MRQSFADFWMIIIILGDVRESPRSRFDVAVLQCWVLLAWSTVIRSGLGVRPGGLTAHVF